MVTFLQWNIKLFYKTSKIFSAKRMDFFKVYYYFYIFQSKLILFITKELCDANKLISSLWRLLVLMSSLSIHNFMGLRKCMRSHIQQRNLMTFASYITVVFLSLMKACSTLFVHRNPTSESALGRIQYSHPHPPLFCLDFWCIFLFSQVFAQNRLQAQSHYKGNAFSLTFSFSQWNLIWTETQPQKWRNGALRVGFWAQVRKWVEAQKAEANQVEEVPVTQEVPGGCEWGQPQIQLLYFQTVDDNQSQMPFM